MPDFAVFAFLDRLTYPQLIALLLAGVAVAWAAYGFIDLLRHIDDLIPAEPGAGAGNEARPPHSTTKFELALIAVSLAAAMVFLDDSAEDAARAHTATAAQRADVQRLQVLNDIVDQRCPKPDAAEREIVLIDWRTSADLHTNAGAHISCERYLQRGWFTAATTPKGPQ